MDNRKKYSFCSQMMLFGVLVYKYFKQKKREKKYAKELAANRERLGLDKEIYPQKDSKEKV
ncbi:MAG: hypothetical protein QM204_05370 [Bacillota bacterium]|jgi:hypothetical protein|nr:hypothetical protein [Bacillota bacterium]NLL26055.1 hypothetical protein [Erysipelotrichia bacterium]